MNRLWAGLAGVGAMAAASFWAIDARGQTATDEHVEGSVGVMLFLGGNLFTTPDNRYVEPRTRQESEGLGFVGDAGGFGWGVGPYAEAHIEEHLGLLLGFVYDQSTIERDVVFDFTDAQRVKTTTDFVETLSITSFRIPVFVKGMVPLSFGRGWAGIGPEIVVGRAVEAERVPLRPPPVEGEMRARQASSIMMMFGLGLAIHLGDTLELPIELRASRNLSQGDNWSDRVEVADEDAENPGDPAHNSYTVRAQSTWDFRLGLGLAYRFGKSGQ